MEHASKPAFMSWNVQCARDQIRQGQTKGLLRIVELGKSRVVRGKGVVGMGATGSARRRWKRVEMVPRVMQVTASSFCNTYIRACPCCQMPLSS